MSITTTRLTRGAGLSAVVAGLLFIVIQLVHPHEDVAAVTTTAGTVRSTANSPWRCRSRCWSGSPGCTSVR